MLSAQRPDRGEAARRELTEAAIDCFSRYGYRGTSIERIAREAGVTKGAIYYHFRDKEDLLSAAVADRVAAFEARVQRACEDADAAESLRRIVAVCIDHARSNDRPRFLIKLMVEGIDTNERLLGEMRGVMRRFRAFVRNVIRSGQEAGQLRPEVDADAAAATLTSAVIGAETQFYLDPERFSLEGSLDSFLDGLVHHQLGAGQSAAPEKGSTRP